MDSSRQIARIVGPTLVALGITEALNIDIFAGNTAPVVYLNGTMLFVAGLAIVQAHNRWRADWSILVTMAGWILFLGGLYRMFAPQAPQVAKGIVADAIFAVLVLAGVVVTYKGFGRGPLKPNALP